MVNLVKSLSRKSQIELELSPGNLRYDNIFFPPIHCCLNHMNAPRKTLVHGLIAWLPTYLRIKPQAPEDKRSSCFFRSSKWYNMTWHFSCGIWTFLGRRWWWWSSLVTKPWGEAPQYARSSAWSGPARLGIGIWSMKWWKDVFILANELLPQNAKLYCVKICEFWGVYSLQ